MKGKVISKIWTKTNEGQRLEFASFIYVVIACLILLFSVNAANAVAQDKAVQLQQLRTSIKRLQQTLENDQGEKSELVKQLRKIEVKVGAISKKVRNLDQKIKQKETKLSSLKQEYDRQSENLGQQKNILSQQVIAAYAMGRQEYLKLLLNQHDPATVARTFVYYDYLNSARKEKIDSVTSRLNDLALLKRKIDLQLQSIAKSRKSLKNEQNALVKSRDIRKRLLVEIQGRIKQKGKKLKGMQLDEKQLLKLVNELQNALSDIPTQLDGDIKKLKGKMKLPVRGYVANKYGSSRGQGLSRWKGVFIKAKPGVDVAALSHGRVVFADWFKGLGLLTIIDHGDGFMSLYGHNQSLYKDAGDWVDAGDVIASVGNTGGNKDSGLYFEIRLNGKPQNPIAWCKR